MGAYRAHLNIRLKLKLFITVGSTLPWSARAGLRGEEEVRRYYEALRQLLKLHGINGEWFNLMLKLLGRYRKGIHFTPEFAVKEINGCKDLMPSIAGSTVKGVFRSLFEQLILEKLVLNERLELIGDKDVSEKLKELIRNYRIESSRVLGTQLGEEIGKEYATTLLALYLITPSPFTCGLLAGDLSILNCSIPFKPDAYRLKESINNVIAEKLSKTCVVVEGSKHCLPLTKICASCAIWGCAGLSSITRFERLYPPRPHDIEYTVLTLNTVLRPAHKHIVTPISYKVLGFKHPVEFRGTITIEYTSEKLEMIKQVSYLREVVDALKGSCNPLLEAVAQEIEEVMSGDVDRVTEGFRGLLKTLVDDYARRYKAAAVIGLRRHIGLSLIERFDVL